jgi:hypothetical protein
MAKRSKKTDDRRPAPAHPGWVKAEDLLVELCMGVGMTRAEARREARKAIKAGIVAEE